MSKKKSGSDPVEEAIRSLYSLFDVPYSCSRANSKQIAALSAKVAERKRQLDNDATLAKLESQLAQVRRDEFTKAMELRRGVEDLHRRFQLYGVTPDLIKEVDAYSKKKPILIPDGCS